MPVGSTRAILCGIPYKLRRAVKLTPRNSARRRTWMSLNFRKRPWDRSAVATYASDEPATSWRSIRSAARRCGCDRTFHRKAQHSATTSMFSWCHLQTRPSCCGRRMASCWASAGAQRRVSLPQVIRLIEIWEFPPLGDVCLTKLGRKLLTWRCDHAENQNQARLDLFDPWIQQTLWPTRKFDVHAHVSLVGQEAVGVMEPDGHFVLVELSSGRTIADSKLDAEKSAADILVVHSGKQYLLLTNTSVPPAPNHPTPQAIGSAMTAYPVQKGRMFSFDESGSLSWRRR